MQGRHVNPWGIFAYCPNFRMKTNKKLLHSTMSMTCSCTGEYINKPFAQVACCDEKGYKQCSHYKQFGIRN